MRDGWTKTTIGEVTRRRTDFTPVVPDSEYVILGVQRSGWGFVQRDPILGRDQKFTKLMQVRSDDLVYRTITAFEAPSAVAGEGEDGLFVTPQTFPTFTIDARKLLPGYMKLLTTSPAFHEEMSRRCTGTVLRRKTLAVGAFQSIPLVLPSLVEQRRIVDLIAALDNTIQAAQDQHAAYCNLTDSIAAAVTGELVEVGALLRKIETGKSPTGVDREPDAGERAVLKLSAIGTRSFDPREVKVVTPEQVLPDGTDVRAGDVLLVRCSGAISRVGAVCQVTQDYPNLFLCDKTLRLVPDTSRIHPFLLTVLLRTPALRTQIEALTTGSDMRNISQAAIRRLKVPVPAPDVQSGLSDALTHLRNAEELSLEASEAALAIRANLLTALLTGEHEIPESYDALLQDGVAA